MLYVSLFRSFSVCLSLFFFQYSSKHPDDQKRRQLDKLIMALVQFSSISISSNFSSMRVCVCVVHGLFKFYTQAKSYYEIFSLAPPVFCSCYSPIAKFHTTKHFRFPLFWPLLRFIFLSEISKEVSISYQRQNQSLPYVSQRRRFFLNIIYIHMKHFVYREKQFIDYTISASIDCFTFHF